MAPPTRTPRNRWIAEGLSALAAGGPEAVRIESLAQGLGVSKGGFYWHFKDRRSLLEEMLNAWERTVVDEVIEAVEAEDEDSRTRLRRLFALAAASGAELLKIELAIRDWARRDEAVAERLRRVDNRRMNYMRSLFAGICADDDDVEARCLLVFSLFIGSHFVASITAGAAGRRCWSWPWGGSRNRTRAGVKSPLLGEQLEHPLDWPCKQGTIAANHDRALQQRGVGQHPRDQLVGRHPNLIQP
jgi:AcrR family transcriptional regulator